MTIKCLEDALPFLSMYRNKRQEHFGIICLDFGLNVISKKVLFVGGINRCLVDPRIIFWYVCKHSASGVILFHNHPSGTLAPTDYDIDLTKSLQKGCDTLGITLADHIIVTKHGYYSFRQHDLLKETEDKELKIAGEKND